MKKKSLKYLSIEQFGECCGVNSKTVVNWIKNGQINAEKSTLKENYKIGIENLSRIIIDTRDLAINEYKLQKDKQLTVLIVDDEKNAIESIEPIFMENGFQISSSTNGYDAMVLLREIHPLILTLDLKIFDLNGIEILKMINNLKLRENTWVIIISGASEEELQSAVDFGADFYLQKPFYNDDLNKIIRKISMDFKKNAA